MLKVSVIVPNYNHSGFLKKRLDSILGQTYKHFEVIILDDCSADNSRDIIEAYRDNPKVSHIGYNEVNSGSTFYQWEKGMAIATGELIWIAESDDYCEPTFLEVLVAPFIEDTGLVISVCQSLFVSKEGKIIYKTYSEYLSEIVDGKTFIGSKMLGSNYIANASMAVFKKSMALNVSQEYKKMKYCGDWYFWTSILFLGKISVSGKYLNYYNRHDNNVASGAVRRGLDFIEGNQMYHYILQNMEVDQATKKAALNIRIEMYLSAKKDFISKEVHDQVISSLYSLDPSVKSLIVKKVVEQRFRYSLFVIKRAIT